MVIYSQKQTSKTLKALTTETQRPQRKTSFVINCAISAANNENLCASVVQFFDFVRFVSTPDR
jgi:hypothetical protein